MSTIEAIEADGELAGKLAELHRGLSPGLKACATDLCVNAYAAGVSDGRRQAIREQWMLPGHLLPLQEAIGVAGELRDDLGDAIRLLAIRQGRDLTSEEWARIRARFERLLTLCDRGGAVPDGVLCDRIATRADG